MMSGGGGNREFDILVYGATGFTGERVVKELIKQGNVRFAAGGRSEKKLKGVLEKYGAPKEVEVVIADVNDQKSLEAMAARASVVLNMVGPYRFWGEQVVKACVAARTHYLDVCGEPEVIEQVEASYAEPAKAGGCFVVSATGFDSIPADLGTLWTASLFSVDEEGGGAPSSVASYLTVKGGQQGFVGHFPTWQCAVEGFGSAGALRKLRASRPRPPPLQVPGPRPRRFTGPFWEKRLSLWSMPFPGADASVVRRTQVALSGMSLAKPVHYSAFFTVPSGFYRLLFMAYGAVFATLAKFPLGRSLLLKFPRFFSNGTFTKKGPTESQIAETSFSMTFFAKGYKQWEPPAETDREPEWEVKTRISGPEPGYVATPVFLVQAAMTLLQERQQIKARLGCEGGVFTAGTLLWGTSYIDRLKSSGITFEDLSLSHARSPQPLQ